MHLRPIFVICLALALPIAGCGLFQKPERPAANLLNPYNGLADKSLAIVIYVPSATLNEYPGTREEISSFLTSQMREHLPTTRLLNPADVADWQNRTLNWFALPGRDIAKHFGVDRVLFIEVLQYSTRNILVHSDLQGRLRARCRIIDAADIVGAQGTALTPPADEATWSGIVDVVWPPYRPLDPTQTDESAVRLRTLESFAQALVRPFHTPTTTAALQ